jgi:hypothetical protein
VPPAFLERDLIKEAQMRIFAEQFSDIRLGQNKNFGNLSIIPIFGELKFRRQDIKTFDTLSSLGLTEASEISESGLVNTIRVLNKSESYLAIFDNDIIIGAKQNRVSKSTVLIPPHEAINLPVYCVERGRWSYDNNRSFRKSEQSLSPLIREKKMMMMKSGRTDSIQNEVWNDVDNLSYKLNAFSSTDSFTEVVGNRDYKDENLLLEFIQQTNALGYLVATGEKIFGELFYDEPTCRQQSLKSVKSWLADATDSKNVGCIMKGSIKEDLINAEWHPVKSIGVETTYEASGVKQGQSVLLQGSFVHGLLYV